MSTSSYLPRKSCKVLHPGAAALCVCLCVHFVFELLKEAFSNADGTCFQST